MTKSFENREGWIWMNGDFIEWKNAKSHIISQGLHYASAVFEGERAYRGKIFKSKEHTKRFFKSAKIIGIPGDVKGFTEIAKRSRGTPRIANRLLRRVRDYAEIKGNNKIDESLSKTALDKLEVDELGLDDWDVLILKSLIEKFGGGPVGLETLAASISEDADTITEVYEPYLLQLGMLDRTRSGRVATARAYNHLGYPPPKNTQPSLL